MVCGHLFLGSVQNDTVSYLAADLYENSNLRLHLERSHKIYLWSFFCLTCLSFRGKLVKWYTIVHSLKGFFMSLDSFLIFVLIWYILPIIFNKNGYAKETIRMDISLHFVWSKSLFFNVIKLLFVGV